MSCCRGRPEKLLKIDDTTEDVARILMNRNTKREGDWQYLKDAPPTSPYQ